MEAWIPITIAAALAQTFRFVLQKRLSTTGLSATGATFARFLYSAPLVLALLWAFMASSGQNLPSAGTAFWIYGASGALTQILATVCVVALFAERNFAVGITFKKTEVLQTALVGYVVLGEGVNALAGVALVIGFLAVLLLSDRAGAGALSVFRRLGNRAAGLGLLSGVFFAISGVCYRGASLSLGSGDFAFRAGVTLAAVVTMQTIAMLVWFAWRDRDQVVRVLRAWRVGALVGMTSMIGSFCWFSAFTLQNAAYVNALGQVELIFSIAASVLVFREKISARELGGIGLLVTSILVLLLAV